MKLTFSSNFPDVARHIKELAKGISDPATASALNKTGAQAKTAMSKEIRQEFNLSAGDVGQSLVLSRARASGKAFKMEVSLSALSRRGGRSLNVAHFGARQVKAGVSIKIKKGGPRKVIPGAFMINEGKTVMIRTGKKRLPIKAVQTIDVQQMFNTKRINAKVLQFITVKFPEVFANEVKFYTARFHAAR